jgi:hypothetical protein
MMIYSKGSNLDLGGNIERIKREVLISLDVKNGK